MSACGIQSQRNADDTSIRPVAERGAAKSSTT